MYGGINPRLTDQNWYFLCYLKQGVVLFLVSEVREETHMFQPSRHWWNASVWAGVHTYQVKKHKPMIFFNGRVNVSHVSTYLKQNKEVRLCSGVDWHSCRVNIQSSTLLQFIAILDLGMLLDMRIMNMANRNRLIHGWIWWTKWWNLFSKIAFRTISSKRSEKRSVLDGVLLSKLNVFLSDTFWWNFASFWPDFLQSTCQCWEARVFVNLKHLLYTPMQASPLLLYQTV